MCNTSYDLTYTDLNPKFLFSCIRQRKEEEQNYHCHDFIELVIILKGKGRFLIDGKEYPASEGTIILLNPGTQHKSIPDADSYTVFTECYLAFTDVEFINCPKNFFPLFQDYKIITKLPEAWKKEIFHLCNSIAAEANSAEPGRYFIL